MGKIRVGLDLDGTLYDALPQILYLNNQILRKLDLTELTPYQYKAMFQSKDWDKLYSDMGINEENGISYKKRQKIIKHAAKRFFLDEDGEFVSPPLILGARLVLHKLRFLIGRDNLTIITNEKEERVKKRFEADGLEDFLQYVRKPSRQGKADEIFKEAMEREDLPFVYVGDLVCDGEDCLEARARQVEKGIPPNIYFYGMTHEYAMNLREDVEAFAKKYEGFARTLSSLHGIGEIFGRFRVPIRYLSNRWDEFKGDPEMGIKPII